MPLPTGMVSTLYHRFAKYFKGVPWEEIDNYFHFSEKDKLYCEYCGIELQEKGETPFPHHAALSLDRKQSAYLGGQNQFENIAICCTRCNVCKGTMGAETFKRMLELLSTDKPALETILNEMFWGRQANMLNRHLGKKEKPEHKLEDYV
jgi:hypothetical protein